MKITTYSDNIKCKISKVELVIGKRKLSLTIEEAVELKWLLAKTFNKEATCRLYPYYPTYPWWDGTYTADPSNWNDTLTDSAIGN